MSNPPIRPFTAATEDRPQVGATNESTDLDERPSETLAQALAALDSIDYSTLGSLELPFEFEWAHQEQGEVEYLAQNALVDGGESGEGGSVQLPDLITTGADREVSGPRINTNTTARMETRSGGASSAGMPTNSSQQAMRPFNRNLASYGTGSANATAADSPHAPYLNANQHFPGNQYSPQSNFSPDSSFQKLPYNYLLPGRSNSTAWPPLADNSFTSASHLALQNADSNYSTPEFNDGRKYRTIAPFLPPNASSILPSQAEAAVEFNSPSVTSNSELDGKRNEALISSTMYQTAQYSSNSIHFGQSPPYGNNLTPIDTPGQTYASSPVGPSPFPHSPTTDGTSHQEYATEHQMMIPPRFWAPDGQNLRRDLTNDEQKELVVHLREQAQTYEHIYGLGVFTVKLSTLRGWVRNKRLPPSQRERTPMWTSRDDQLLKDTVRREMEQKMLPDAKWYKISWKNVTEYMELAGSSKKFSPSGAKKRYESLKEKEAPGET